MALLVFAASAQSLFGCVYNVIPFGVTASVVTNHAVGQTFAVNSSDVGAAKEGKLNLNGYLNTAMWFSDMAALGCGCQVCTGPVPFITGNAQVLQAFAAIPIGSTFIMPLVDQFDTSGSKPANIIGFILVKETSFSSNGSNWFADLQLLSAPLPLGDESHDSDGDGVSDFNEFAAGTDWTNSTSFVRIISIEPEDADLRITWTTVPGKTYVLQRSFDPVTNFIVFATVTNVTGNVTNRLDFGAATNSTAQFYRVRLVP